MRVIALILGILLTQAIFPAQAAALMLILPDRVPEDSGLLSNGGTVTIPKGQPSDLVVRLSSSDTAQVSVPETVVIRAGETSVPFSIRVLDNREVQGTQETFITASVPGWVSDMRRTEVADNEPLDLFIGVEEEDGEGGGFPNRKGTVTIPPPLSFDLAVTESRERDARDVNIAAFAPGWSRAAVTIRVLK